MNTNKIDIDKNVNIHLESKTVSRHFFVFLWLMYAFVNMTKNAYSGSMADIVTEGVLTKSQTGLITAIFYLLYTPLQVVGGVYADKFSPERIIKIGLIGASISNAIIFFNQNYYVMLFSWAFNAMVQFGIWPATFKIVSSQLVRSDRKQMAFYISLSSTGGLLFSYLIAAFVPRWQYNFAISAIVLIVLAITLHIYEKHLNPYMKWDKPIEQETTSIQNHTLTLGQIFSKSGFYYVLVTTILATIVVQSRSSLTPIMLVESYDNISPSLGNLLNILLILSGITGTLIAGRLVSKIKNVIRAWKYSLFCTIPFIALIIFVGKIPTYSIVFSLCVVAALDSFCMLMRTNYTMTFSKYGKSGTAAGILNSGMASAYVIVSYGVARLVELTSWSTYGIVLTVIITSAALILIVPAKIQNNILRENNKQ